MPSWAAEVRHPDASWPMKWLLWDKLDKFPAPLSAALGRNASDGFPSYKDCRRLDGLSGGWVVLQVAESTAQVGIGDGNINRVIIGIFVIVITIHDDILISMYCQCNFCKKIFISDKSSETLY